MYNRYVPRPDGSYTKKTVPEPTPHSRPSAPPPRYEEAYAPPPPPQHEQESYEQHTQPKYHNSAPGTNPWDFLKRLLPRDFDTGDLLIIILLLLMAGDSDDDKNTALLTLALYLFM